MQELEDKIRKYIPELMELGIGCVIKPKYRNEFIIDSNYKITNFNTIICLFTNTRYSDEYYTIIGKPIQLNHVVKYLQNKNKVWSVDLLEVLSLWDLKSNLLSDQSSELKEYLNNI